MVLRVLHSHDPVIPRFDFSGGSQVEDLTCGGSMSIVSMKACASNSQENFLVSDKSPQQHKFIH